MKKLALSLVVLSCMGHAQAYQVEAGGELDNSDYVDTLTIGGEYHFNGVNATSGPFAEASFIEQSTFVRAAVIDTDFGGNNLLGGGRYVDKNSGFFFDGNLVLGDLDGFELGGGIYLGSSTTVGAFYNTNDLEDTFGGSVKHLIFINDNTYLNLEGGASFGEFDATDADRTSFFGSADYYFDKTFSVGGGLEFVEIEGETFTTTSNNFGFPVTFVSNSFDESITVLSLNGRKFLKENISVSGGLTYADSDRADSDLGILIGGSMRF